MDAVDVGRALVMILFSAVTLVTCWINYLDLSSSSNQYGLVVGPPTPTTLTALFVFNIVASVICGVEVLNALSVPFCEGRPRLPLELEQCLALVAGSVPLAAINLSIVVCRMRHHTPLQISCCAFLVLNFLVRMVYARAFAQEYKSCGRAFKACVYAVVAVLAALLLVLAGLVWGRVNASFRPVPSAGSEWLRGVSVLLLRAPALEGRTVDQYDLTSLLRRQTTAINKPWLVKDLLKLSERRDAPNGVLATYSCHMRPESHDIRPDQCAGVNQLLFRFRYNHNWEWSHRRPLGVVSYNVAQVSNTESGSGQVCEETNSTLTGGWQLFYLSVVLQARSNWTVAVLVDSPWKDACTVPYPEYDPSIPVCS